jgi:hypothetical protein
MYPLPPLLPYHSIPYPLAEHEEKGTRRRRRTRAGRRPYEHEQKQEKGQVPIRR